MRGWKNLLTGMYRPIYREFPIYGAAADIKAGAVVMAGTTEEQDNGMVIVGAVTYADVVGVLASLHDYSEVGDSDDATGSFVWGKVDVNPFNTWLCEVDTTASTLITGATSSGGTITMSGFDNAGVDTGWWYVVSGAGAGQLRYIKQYDADAPVVATAFSPSLVAADKSLVVMPLLHEVLDLNSDATKCLACETGQTDGSVPSGTIMVVQNYIKTDGIAFQKLDATLHDGLSGLNTQNPHFYSEIFFLDHAFNRGT